MLLPCSAATPLTMTNPLFSENLLALIRSLSDADQQLATGTSGPGFR
jgi:hypothetical protein